MSDVPDWRIGLRVKLKYRSHPLFGMAGRIIEVYPSGTAGIDDKNGVIKVLMNESDYAIVCGADDFVTA